MVKVPGNAGVGLAGWFSPAQGAESRLLMFWADVLRLAFAGAVVVVLLFLHIPQALLVPQVCAQV